MLIFSYIFVRAGCSLHVNCVVNRPDWARFATGTLVSQLWGILSRLGSWVPPMNIRDVRTWSRRDVHLPRHL